MSSPVRDSGSPPSRIRAPVPPALIPVEGTFKRNVTVVNPLSNTALPSPQTSDTADEPSVFVAESANLAECPQNSNTISASGESTSYRTVPVANSAVRGDRLMFQNSLLNTSGESTMNETTNGAKKGSGDVPLVQSEELGLHFHRGSSSSFGQTPDNSGQDRYGRELDAGGPSFVVTAANARAGTRNPVYSSQEGIAPLSKGILELRRQNIYLTVFLLVVALVLAVIGGVCIGVVSNHYSKVTSVNYLELKNRIVLNSSLSSLTESSAQLVMQAEQLERFVLTHARNYSTPAQIRDDLRDTFFNSWMLWLNGRDSGVSLHSIKVPFCDEFTGLTTCDVGMLLSVQCAPKQSDAAPLCLFFENSDNGSSVDVHRVVPGDDSVFTIGDVVRTYDYSTIYGTIRVNTSDGLFLVPSFVNGPDDGSYFFLKFAEQNYLPSGRVVFAETGSFLNTWFAEFQSHMQSAEDSISVLFMNNGTILEYGYGPDVPRQTAPCSADGTHVNTVHVANEHCSSGAGGLVDAFVREFVSDMPQSLLSEDVIHSQGYSRRLNVKHYTVAYQDFLRFRTAEGDPNVIFFAAYATPIDTGIGKEGVIQIVICVVIIVVCLLVLGCITLLTVTSLQRVVEMVSVVANYAATYDTDAMARVLNKSIVKHMPHTKASTVVRSEFFRILENLNAYRPFLPPALLTAEGLGSVGDATESQVSEHSPTTGVPSTLSPAEDESTVPLPRQESSDTRHAMSPQSTQAPLQDTITDVSGSTYVAVYSTRSDIDSGVESGVFRMATNSRLSVSGLRAVKGTVLVVVLSNTNSNVEQVAQLVNAFVKTVLHAAATYNGVVDVLDATRIVVTFNCHFTTPRHADKACKCALRIKHDLRHSGCSVSMGISTGTNYVGTIGTDKQKARVVTGECVAVANALVHLRHYLGGAIFATESAAHVSTCPSVPVDVVSIFSEGTRSWHKYIVWEILTVATLEMDPQAGLTKKLFRMIRSQQGKAALAIAEAYVTDAEKKNEAVSWRLARMLIVLKRHQSLVGRGYVRCLTYWQSLEATENSPVGEAELGKTFLAALGEAQEDDSANRRTSDDTSNRAGPTNNPDEETSRVRQILGEESQRISATKRRMVTSHQQRDPEDSDGALFDVYLPEPNEVEECPESQPPSTSQRTTAASLVARHSRNNSSDPAGQASLLRAAVMNAFSGDFSVVDNASEGPIPPLLPVELVSGARQHFYRTNEVLGHGTYGNVFLAITEKGLFEAVKVFPVEEFNTPQLIREVETLAQLRSDYIVAYDCCGAQNGYFFICTEYLAGGSLRRLLKNVPCLPPSIVRKYSRDILLGLQYLHSRNWTHCDIKPENVLLSGDGVCKLADFGNAALARSWAEDTSSIRGTARYMAPEAVLSEWKPPADVFSLGITMAFMLTGHHPWSHYPERDHLFVARYAGEIRHALERNEPCAMEPDLSMPEVEAADAELCQIVRSCCSFHPADRPTVDTLLNYMT